MRHYVNIQTWVCFHAFKIRILLATWRAAEGWFTRTASNSANTTKRMEFGHHKSLRFGAWAFRLLKSQWYCKFKRNFYVICHVIPSSSSAIWSSASWSSAADFSSAVCSGSGGGSEIKGGGNIMCTWYSPTSSLSLTENLSQFKT